MTQEFSLEFERGGKYFYLTTLRSTHPTSPTTIRHPTPCGNSEDEIDFCTEDDLADHIQEATPRAKVHFQTDATTTTSSFESHKPKLTSSHGSRRSRGPVPTSSKPLNQSQIPDTAPSTPTHAQHSPPSEIQNFRVSEQDNSLGSSNLFSGDLPNLTSSDDSSTFSNTSNSKGNADDARKQSKPLLPMKTSMKPINAKVSDSSPYDLPRKLTVYNSKAPQTWFYDRRKRPILIPPTPAPDITIPFKSIYVCDIINSQGNCSKRQVWINNGKERVQWVVADKTHAVLNLGGSTYIAYVNDEGPHWVKKETWQKYKKTHVSD